MPLQILEPLIIGSVFSNTCNYEFLGNIRAIAYSVKIKYLRNLFLFSHYLHQAMNPATDPANILPEPPRSSKLHLAFLDGIRGLAALYVVLVHCWEPSLVESSQLALLWSPMTKFMRYGIFAVVIFVVLSGYCLMLPVVRSNKKYLSGGLLGFFKRRIRRILPPYYAALIFCLIIGVSLIGLQRMTILTWDADRLNTLSGLFSANFSFYDVFIYFLLLQNFDLHFNDINGPMWTVAVEFQIYIIFALLLIPIWRRFGMVSTVITAFVLGLTLHYSMGEFTKSTYPWFIGIFAIGMAAAEINFSQKPSLIKIKTSLPWCQLGAIFVFLAFVTEWLRFETLPGLELWIVHSFLALGSACLIIFCTNFVIQGKSLPPVFNILESRWVLALGVISYSLYLTHAPIVFLVHQFLLSFNLSPTAMATKWLLISLPLSLLVANVFHRIFERPFMSSSALNLKSQK
ncbi:MAG: acyltransferase [Scytonema sp. PMC 1070.18]|nr:acyltransferase [Scytonema sp. PMC 1070.18]